MNTQKNYRYRLSRSSKKYICPNCGKKELTYYEDELTSEELPDFGRCDREISCGYHLHPNHDKTRQNTSQTLGRVHHIKHNKPAPVALIPDAELEALRTPDTLRGSQFFRNIVNHGIPDSFDMNVFNRYKIGALDGCTAFPYINRKGGIRAVSLIEYGANNHRVKDSVKNKWLHTYIEKNHFPLPDWIKPYSAQEKKATALFGEHLLDLYPNNPLSVVEAPKTAIIAALYSGLPTDETTPIWVAVGAMNRLGGFIELLAKEKNRRPSVTLYPDLSAYDKWKEVSARRFRVDSTLEEIATNEDRENKLDLADFLWRYAWVSPKNATHHPKTPQETPHSNPHKTFKIKASHQETPKTPKTPLEKSENSFSGESWEEADKDHSEWPPNGDIESYIATLKPDSVEQNLPPTYAPANERFPITFSGERPPMDAYFWVSGKAGKTYLMPDDQKWMVNQLEPIDNRTRQDLMREHERLFLDTYHQTVGSKPKKDEIARRTANTWLRELVSSTDKTDEKQRG